MNGLLSTPERIAASFWVFILSSVFCNDYIEVYQKLIYKVE